MDTAANIHSRRVQRCAASGSPKMVWKCRSSLWALLCAQRVNNAPVLRCGVHLIHARYACVMREVHVISGALLHGMLYTITPGTPLSQPVSLPLPFQPTQDSQAPLSIAVPCFPSQCCLSMADASYFLLTPPSYTPPKTGRTRQRQRPTVDMHSMGSMVSGLLVCNVQSEHETIAQVQMMTSGALPPCATHVARCTVPMYKGLMDT